MTGLPLFIEQGKYSCPVCPQRFFSLGEKRQHIRVHHSSTKKKGAKQ